MNEMNSGHPEKVFSATRYVTISENIFRDLLNDKSKIEDIKVLLATRSGIQRQRFMKKLNDIVYMNRYNDTDGVIR